MNNNQNYSYTIDYVLVYNIKNLFRIFCVIKKLNYVIIDSVIKRILWKLYELCSKVRRNFINFLEIN